MLNDACAEGLATTSAATSFFQRRCWLFQQENNHNTILQILEHGNVKKEPDKCNLKSEDIEII